MLERMYKQYRQRMWYVAYKILEDESLAEDAVHEAFIRIARNLNKIEAMNQLQEKAYIVTIVRNVALTMVKEEANYFDFSEYQDLIVDKKEVEKQVLDKMELKAYISAIHQLPEKYRDVLYLYMVQEHSIHEIAKLLDLSQEVVKKRIQRGRKKILQSVRRGT